MILLQNPNIPTSVNPVEIDSAILDIKSELETSLTWLTHGYGRAFKNLDITNGERVYFPEIYLGKQNGSFRYTNISPDNDKQGQCFFYVRRETISEYQTGMYSFLNYDVALIFSVNMELINATLTETDVFQQVLVAQVRDVLTRQILGKSYVLTVNTVEFLFEDVFREFNLTEQSTMEKSPLSHFRFNISVKLPEVCPTPSIVPPVLTCYSLDFDGVNEFINCTNNSVFDFSGLNAFSFETWVKFDNLTGLRMLISKWELPPAPVNARGYYFGTTGNQLRFGFFNTNSTLLSVITNEIINIGQWYHLCLTYDGSGDVSGVNIYIDSVLATHGIAVNTLSGTTLNTLPLQIGGQQTFYMAGQIAKSRVWNVELTTIQVVAEYNGGTILSPPVQGANLILDTDINNATFNGSEWDVPDLTGITSGYQSANMETGDRIEDCPL